MKAQKIWYFLLFSAYFFEETGTAHNGYKKLSRKRRYLAFPEGASFSAVFCLTNLMGITPGSDIFSMNINWGLVYELPNETKPVLDLNKPAMKRRNRRDLYARIETVLASMGYDGRSCILRSLCEAGQKFKAKEGTLIDHILSLIFRFPQETILNNEPESHRMYHYASQVGLPGNSIEMPEYPDDADKCSEIFRCPFSLIDLALGYYSHSGV